MANATWPASLPQSILLAGWSEKPPDTRLRSSMDQGVAKQRNRYTANKRPMPARIYVDSTQLDTFDAFYVTTLENGVLRFDWKNPRTGNAVEMRFQDVPTYKRAGTKYIVEMMLEIMP